MANTPNLLEQMNREYAQQLRDFQNGYAAPEDLAMLKMLNKGKETLPDTAPTKIITVDNYGNRHVQELPPFEKTKLPEFKFPKPNELPPISTVYDSSNVSVEERMAFKANTDFEFKSSDDLLRFMKRSPLQFVETLEQDDKFRANFNALLPLMFTSEIRQLSYAFQSQAWTFPALGGYKAIQEIIEPQAKDFFGWVHLHMDKAHNNPYHKIDSFIRYHKEVKEPEREKAKSEWDKFVEESKKRVKEEIEQEKKVQDLINKQLAFSQKIWEKEIEDFFKKVAEMRQNNPDWKFSVFDAATADLFSKNIPQSLQTGDNAQDAMIGLLLMEKPEKMLGKVLQYNEHNPAFRAYFEQNGLNSENMADKANLGKVYQTLSKMLVSGAIGLDENDVTAFMSETVANRVENLRDNLNSGILTQDDKAMLMMIGENKTRVSVLINETPQVTTPNYEKTIQLSAPTTQTTITREVEPIVPENMPKPTSNPNFDLSI